MICYKCKAEREVHSVHYHSDGSILNFCAECVWRLEKGGYRYLDSFLKDEEEHNVSNLWKSVPKLPTIECK
jgi:hypothetical protein